MLCVEWMVVVVSCVLSGWRKRRACCLTIRARNDLPLSVTAKPPLPTPILKGGDGDGDVDVDRNA